MTISTRLATLALLLFLAFTPAARAQTSTLKTASQLELDVIKVLLRQETAWNRGDLDAFAEGYKNSPDTLFINTNQVQRGYDSMIAAYHHNYPTSESMGTLNFTDLEVHPLGDSFALCLGRFHLERNKKNGGNAEGLFSLVLEKTSAGWKIVVDHTT
ncbi:MAG TPA: nuclear transport factor 2 family protein [Granulicella sp.]|jgi:ketosteroid isomerase-like protein|nr:nuclear transport factor 2 family protein [Granulicella sp.]